MSHCRCYLLLALPTLLTAGQPACSSERQRLSFNEGWRFHLGSVPGHAPCSALSCAPCGAPLASDPCFNDDAWRQLSVPHDFVVEGNFTPLASLSHGYLPMTTGWYRKSFELPEDWKTSAVWIQFDGVYRNSDVYLNGHLLGHHDSGYTSFFYYFGGMAHYGATNVLAVYADASKEEGWWYEGGGIYRHVWLNRANQVHSVPWGVYAPALVTGDIADGKLTDRADVLASAEISNLRDVAAEVSIRYQVTDMQGQEVGGLSTARVSTRVPKQGFVAAEAYLVLKGQIKLWSPQTPGLYRLSVAVFHADSGTCLDEVKVTFGVRRVIFDAQRGLLLNDVPLKIQGVCNHQDFAGVGTAVPMGLQQFRIQKQKELGVNAWRMSHNPPNPELLDGLDSAGMLVWAETRNFGDDPQWIQDFADMVKRDRNHPSILFWSICNEGWRPEGCKEGTEDGLRIARRFRHTALQIDPHGQRAITAAMDLGWGTGMSDALDVQGVNYNYYEYDLFHAAHPSKPVLGSETASCSTDRGTFVPRLGRTTAYATLRDRGCDLQNACPDTCLQDSLSPIMANDFVAGGFVWTGFDYKGEPTPDAWPVVNSHYGAMFDIAGFRKDAYYFYKSWWSSEQVVHVLPHWNWEQPKSFPGPDVKVWVYTNAPQVALYRNGQLHGQVTIQKYSHASFHVPYEPGNLTAVGLSTSGQVLSHHTVLTSGQPKSLLSEVVWGATGISSAVDNNVALVSVKVLDAAGRFVPTATNVISFEVFGGCNAIVSGVGNGDPSSLEPDRSSQRRAFAGKAMAVVQCREEGSAEEVIVTARSAGLSASSVKLPVLLMPSQRATSQFI